MSTSSRRTLVQALAVSLLLHAVLLSSAVRLFPARLEVQPASLTAVISERGAAGPASSPSPARSPSAAAPPAVRRIVTAPPVAAGVEAQASAASHENSPPAPPGAAGHSALSPGGGAAASPSPGSSATPGAASNASSGAAPGAAVPAARSGVSGDDLRQYRLSLAGAARRFKRYPALARQRGWEGTVEVALSVSALVPVPEVVVVRSSGRSVLDEQAVDMLAQAARVTALPEGLKARDFRIVLPVEFSLESDQ